MKTLGKKIKEERTRLKMSQQDLAKCLGMDRVAISNIENGKRNVSVDELMKFSKTLNASVNELLGLSEKAKISLANIEEEKQRSQTERINVPQKNIRKFKEVLLYILKKVGAKPNIGETVIYKLLYFIDFDYYEIYEEQLIGATYKKNLFGPTPLEFQKIVTRMERSKELAKITIPYYNYIQKKYIPLREPDLSEISGREIDLINDVLKRLSDMSAQKISEYSHNDIPWLTTDDEKVIEYEAVFYRTPEYSARDYNEDEEVQ